MELETSEKNWGNICGNEVAVTKAGGGRARIWNLLNDRINKNIEGNKAFFYSNIDSTHSSIVQSIALKNASM